MANPVIRIVDASTGLLGIRREVECAANTAAGLLGIAPEVLYFIEPEGCLVTRYIKGSTSRPRRSSRRTTSGVWRASCCSTPVRLSLRPV